MSVFDPDALQGSEQVPTLDFPEFSEPAERGVTQGAQGLAGLALLGSLAACGGGESADTALEARVAVEPLATQALPTVAEAARFLTQATPGYTAADLSSVAATGYTAWLNKQFALPRSQSHCDWLNAHGYNAASNIFSTAGLDNTIWRKLIGSGDPLRQRMVLALSEICVVSVLGVNSSWRQYAVAHYLDLLEANAFGNYRKLLQDISLSPAMGYYLTFRGSAKANPKTGSEPDENYARELMQLFTIGLVQLNPDGSVKTRANGTALETYTQADVSGLARVFTGWNVDVSGLTSPYPADFQQRPMVSVASQYETGSKTFLGKTIAAGTPALDALNQALDTLFQHPNLPPFISRQLIQRLVTSNPSPAYVARVSAVFANNGAGVRGDLQAVLKAILLDTEARSATTAALPTFGKLREPVMRFLAWARAYRANSATNTWAVGDLSDPATRLGQSPMRSGSVFNFFRPGYVPPGTALASQGLVGPEFQIANESSVAGYINYMQRVVTGSGAGDLTPDYSSLLPLAADAAALVAEINRVLAGGQLSAQTLSLIQAAVTTLPSSNQPNALRRIQAALTLVLASPEFIVQK